MRISVEQSHRRAFLAAFLVLFAAVWIGVPDPANAQRVKPRPNPERCDYLLAEIGERKLWQGVFAGRREAFFETFGRFETTSQVACFRSQKACQLWLYWMQSDWPYDTFRIGCGRGIWTR